MLEFILNSISLFKLADFSVVETERSIDHTGSEKSPWRIVQQWGILVNSLTAEPAIWKNGK